MKLSNTAKDLCSYVMMAFIFSIPISTSVANVLAILIVLLWIADGNFEEKFTEIWHNKIALAILAYIAIHIAGLLWTEDMSFGLYTIKKQWKLLLMPFFLGMVKKEHTQYYIWAFIWAMMFSVLVSYSIWFNLITIPDPNADQSKLLNNIGTFIDTNNQIYRYTDPTPFSSHIVYSPFLALAIYFLSSQLPSYINQKSKLTLSSTALLVMIANMFITHGRTGQVAFIALLLLFIFQCISNNGHRFLIIGIGLSTILVSYFHIPPFQERIDTTIYNANHFNEHSENSITERLIFLSVSSNIIKSNPIIGVGTGDFPNEHKNIVQQRYPNSPYSIHSSYHTANPHNQYLLTTTQFGLIGLLVFLSIFYQQYKTSIESSSTQQLKRLQFALPLFFMTIMLADSYLQTSSSALLFSAYSSIFYKQQINRNKLIS